MQTASAQLSNTLEIWLDNMLDQPDAYTELVMVSASPFDRLYSEYNISVTTLVQDGQLMIAVGHDGAADVVHTCQFDTTTDFKPGAAEVVTQIARIIDLEEFYAALYVPAS